MSFTIIGTGSALPAHIVTNDDLAAMVDTSDEWIRTRTGIHQRHVMTTESLTDLAVTAARRALEMSGTRPEELDAIIGATVQGDFINPGVACLLQHEIGASCPCVDMNAACSGFLYSMDYADGLFVRHKAKRVLIVAAEGVSRLLDWKDRSTCVLFGDGAGAAVFAPGDDLQYIHLVAQGSMVLHVPPKPGDSPFDQREHMTYGLRMDGRETYRFAVNTMCAELQKASDETGIPLEKVDHFLLHQANQRILDAAMKRLHIPAEKVPTTIAETANTSAASVPILLDTEVRAGHLHRGDQLMMCAFGSGLSAGTAAMTWGID